MKETPGSVQLAAFMHTGILSGGAPQPHPTMASAHAGQYSVPSKCLQRLEWDLAGASNISKHALKNCFHSFHWNESVKMTWFLKKISCLSWVTARPLMWVVCAVYGPRCPMLSLSLSEQKQADHLCETLVTHECWVPKSADTGPVSMWYGILGDRKREQEDRTSRGFCRSLRPLPLKENLQVFYEWWGLILRACVWRLRGSINGWRRWYGLRLECLAKNTICLSFLVKMCVCVCVFFFNFAKLCEVIPYWVKSTRKGQIKNDLSHLWNIKDYSKGTINDQSNRIWEFSTEFSLQHQGRRVFRGGGHGSVELRQWWREVDTAEESVGLERCMHENFKWTIWKSQ